MVVIYQENSTSFHALFYSHHFRNVMRISVYILSSNGECAVFLFIKQKISPFLKYPQSKWRRRSELIAELQLFGFPFENRSRKEFYTVVIRKWCMLGPKAGCPKYALMA